MSSPADNRIRELFPNLSDRSYRQTSPESPDYNCIAWAAGYDDKWWQAVEVPGYHWPKDIPRDGSLKSAVLLFRSLGFELCESADLEDGYEKIAIYGKEKVYEHAARQLKNGKWTSKLGALEDIEHDSLDGLVGLEYGVVIHVMRRPKQTTQL